MAVTAQHVTHENEAGRWLYGSWTADATVGDHTITFPEHIAYIRVYSDTSGANPNILIKHVGESDETILIDGGPTQALATTPTDATGITITNYSNGTCSVLVDSDSLVNSGVNCWIALTKK